MWRRILLTAAALLCVQLARAQQPLYPQPAIGNSPAFPNRPAMPGVNGFTPTPGPGGAPAMPGTSLGPTVTPPAPVMAPPSGANPGLPVPTAMPAAVPSLENTVAFDPDLVNLDWQNNRWQLVAGPVFIKDFGPYETQGRQVLRVVRDLRLNTLTTLGSPRPIMEYWLSNGEAPRGSVAGMHSLPIDTATLKAEQVQGQWCVHDASRILFNFGQQGDACRQALAVVQRYGFTEVAYVGQVTPVMLVFLANPAAPAPAPPAAQSPNRIQRLFGASGQQTQPNAAAQQPQQQPGQMPAVPTQPLTTAQGTPPRTPGSILPASLRLPGSEAADRVAIDARQLQVRHEGGDWKLAMGNHIVATFGPNEGDARLAQAALRYYHCTEQVFVGNPRPMFSYFLSNSQAPHGSSYAINAIAFRPDSLQVRQMGTSYVLYDGTQILLSFGERATEAQQVLEAIQHYKFDRLASIGRGDQSMMLFVRAN
jgi:hypothetical protein